MTIEERILELEEAQHELALEYATAIFLLYSDAIRELEKEVADWYIRHATSNGITYGEAKKYLKPRELREFRLRVSEYIKGGKNLDPKWVANLRKYRGRFRVSRLEALEIHCQQIVESLKADMAGSFDDFAQKAYDDCYYHSLFELQRETGVGFTVKALDKDKVAKALLKPWAFDGRNFSERIWGDRNKLVSELNSLFTRGAIQNTPPQKLIAELSKRMNVSKSNAERLILTENAFFTSKATLDAYETSGVEQYQVLATLDHRTSDICRGMDGKVFKRSEYEIGITAPPFHVRCRTTTVPYFDDDFNTGRIARGLDGKTYIISSKMTYPEWYEKFVK